MSEHAAPGGELTSAIESLDDATAARILADLSGPRLRSATAEPQWTPDLARALCAETGAAPAAGQTSAGDLARAALLLHAHDPDLREPIAAMIRNPAPTRFALDPVTGTMLATFALLALQSHIEFSRDKDGRWQFKFKHKPSGASTVAPLIKKLVELISGSPPKAT